MTKADQDPSLEGNRQLNLTLPATTIELAKILSEIEGAPSLRAWFDDLVQSKAAEHSDEIKQQLITRQQAFETSAGHLLATLGALRPRE